MKQIRVPFLMFCGLAACAPEEPATTTVDSDITANQGVSYQGVSYQGVSYQGVSYQGASYGGVALSDASVSGTALVVWTQRPNGVWEQRFPDRMCLWNSTRTTLTTCLPVSLATVPSPLTGTTWQAVFTQPDGTVVQVPVQIGATATAVGSVQSDTALAMFALNGTSATSCAPTVVAQGQITADGQRCDAPGGCRVSCDVWLYDVRVVGSDDGSGQPLGLCPAGERATALAGTWDATGAFTASSTAFTFACTGGTIAKCTRWGYRPWETAAIMSDGTHASLAPYHQACIRAAVADYCADGTSWTRNGTLVDVYDYQTVVPGQNTGFIERTRTGVVPRAAATAFVWESSFDGWGAAWLDHTRYMGISSPNTPALECNSFTQVHESVPPGGGGVTRDPWQRNVHAKPIGSPLVFIDSAPVCAHDEWMTGTWLHPGCSDCTSVVASTMVINIVTGVVTYPYAHCVQPGQHWDAVCVQGAQSRCMASQRMTSHGECVTGGGIGRFATGCSARLESTINPSDHSRPYDHCETNWDSTCVAGANARCTGGMETTGSIFRPGLGFCGQSTIVLDGG